MPKQASREAGEKPRIRTWKRAPFGYMRLSLFTEQGWQTKPPSYVNANESHCVACFLMLCCGSLKVLLQSAFGESPEEQCRHNAGAGNCWFKKINKKHPAHGGTCPALNDKDVRPDGLVIE